MTNLTNAGQTMTSMQIAEVTGKQHCDVLRAIRNMEPAWEKITESKFTLRYKINELANGVKKEIPYYELTKTECLYIATKFNDEARARLILRWAELENEKAAQQQPEKGEVSDSGKNVPENLDDSMQSTKFAMSYIREWQAGDRLHNVGGIFMPRPKDIRHCTPVWSVNAPTAVRGVGQRERQCRFSIAPNLSKSPTMKDVSLTKESDRCEIRQYFDTVLELSQSGERFPVDMNTVWPLVYSEKSKAVRALKENFIKGIDYQVLAQKGENPNGGRPQENYMLSTACLEYFIARKVRAVFEVYRAVFHAAAQGLIAESNDRPQRHPTKAETEVLPPPIDNTLPNSALVEIVNGKAVTSSRKLAALLGRDHSDVLRTIRNNLDNRRFRHYQFISRAYRSGTSGRGYEFLITRRGLDALAGVMRYGAKDKIKEAYKGAWPSKATAATTLVLPMPESLEAEEEKPEPGETALPMLPIPEDIEETTKPAQAETASDESDEEIAYTPKQQKYIDWLEGYNEVLVDRLNKTKAAKELYADLYENEKKRRLRNGEAMGYWHDLYEDLMFRLLGKDDSPLAEKMEAHATFRKRISKG